MGVLKVGLLNVWSSESELLEVLSRVRGEYPFLPTQGFH